MTIIGIDHVQLAMPPGREADARAFYSDLLGIPEVPKPPELAKRGGAWFENGLVKVHLGVDSHFVPARKAHPALLVDALDDLLFRLSRAGVNAEADPALPGFKRTYVADPFGNRLELLEPLSSREE